MPLSSHPLKQPFRCRLAVQVTLQVSVLGCATKTRHSSHQIQAIFERLQQVDVSDARQKGGTGLGLAICRNIIEQHGGKIWVESTVNQGSAFYIELPLNPYLSNRVSPTSPRFSDTLQVLGF
jgi:signal transduction histidine kinase